MAAKSERGLGSPKVSDNERRSIASKGGKAAHERGTAHEFNSREAREAGRKGGETTAERHGADFYSEIGRKGGENSRGGGRKSKKQ